MTCTVLCNQCLETCDKSAYDIETFIAYGWHEKCFSQTLVVEDDEGKERSIVKQFSPDRKHYTAWVVNRPSGLLVYSQD